MPASITPVVGVGMSSSQVVSSFKTVTVPAGDPTFKWRQLGSETTPCGTYVISSGPDGGVTNDTPIIHVAIDAGDWSEGSDSGSIALAWRGSCYLHGIPPSRVYFARASPATGLDTDITQLKYATYR